MRIISIQTIEPIIKPFESVDPHARNSMLIMNGKSVIWTIRAERHQPYPTTTPHQPSIIPHQRTSMRPDWRSISTPIPSMCFLMGSGPKVKDSTPVARRDRAQLVVSARDKEKPASISASGSFYQLVRPAGFEPAKRKLQILFQRGVINPDILQDFAQHLRANCFFVMEGKQDNPAIRVEHQAMTAFRLGSHGKTHCI